jgi:hypothetical protein
MIEEKVKFEITASTPKEPVGWIETDLPKSVMTRLESYIEHAKEASSNLNSGLAGNISKSLNLEDKDNWFFKTILIPLIDHFQKTYPVYLEKIGNVLTEEVPLCLQHFWVNFQKENEFQPPHNHIGVWSFVIWVKIPTDWREQHALPFSVNSNKPKASDFEFYFTSMLGILTEYTFKLDKESEGHILLFPAKLMHTVHPFYNCDKERISISGNICFDVSRNSNKKD